MLRFLSLVLLAALVAIAPIVHADDHGDSREEATSVAPNSTTAGSLEAGGDVDYFRFELTSRGVVGVETTGSIDTYCRLEGQAGQWVGFGVLSDGRICRSHTVLEEGTYWIRVSGRGNDTTGDYTLKVSHTEATSVVLNSATSGSLGVEGVPGYFRFEVLSRGVVVVETSGDTDTYCRLLGETGYKWSNGDGGSGDNCRMEYLLDPGTYWALVDGRYSANGDYTLHISHPGALSVEPNSTTSGNFRGYRDNDYFRFELLSWGLVVMETTGATDTDCILEGEAGRIDEDSDDGFGQNCRIEVPLNAGTYWIRVYAGGPDETGHYDLHVSHVEPISVVPNSATSGSIGVEGDPSYHRFELPARGVVVVETTGDTDSGHRRMGYDLGPYCVLENRADRLSSDSGSGAGANCRIERLVDPGVYYVRVGGRRGDAIVASGDYTLWISYINRAEAVSVAPGSATSGSLEAQGDSDYFHFELASKALVVVETTGDTDTVCTLDGERRRIATDEDGGSGTNCRIEQVLAPGGYYVMAQGQALTATGDYTLRISHTVDDHGDNRAGATLVAPHSATSGSLTWNRDSDYFRFEMPSRSFVVLETLGSTDTYGRLESSDGEVIGAYDDGGSGANFRIERALDSGAYYILVGGARMNYGTTATGDYTLRMSHTGGDDHGASRAQATRVAANSATPGSLELPGDSDYFRFDLPSRGVVAIETLGGTDTYGRLENGAAQLMGVNDDGGSGFNFRIERSLEPGVHYVLVQGYDWTVTGDYTLRVSHTPERHPDLVVSDISASASTLPPGGSFTLSATVRNQAGVGGRRGEAEPTTLRWRRSTDSTIESSDLEVGTDHVDALARNGTSGESITLAAPPNAGAYHYGACVDAVDGERNVANNCSHGVSITVDEEATGSDDQLRITTAVRTAIPFQTIPLAVSGAAPGAEYDLLVDLSGSGRFEEDDTIEVAPVKASGDQLLMAAPLLETLAHGNTVRRFAVRVRERGGEAVSELISLTLDRVVVPAARAGHPTVIMDVVLNGVYQGLGDPLLTADAGAIEPGGSVRVARALGLSTAYSDAQAEALLRSLFGGAHERVTNCVAEALDGSDSGGTGDGPFEPCVRIVQEDVVGTWGNHGEKIRSAGNFLRHAAPRLADALGAGTNAQQLLDMNAAKRQVIGLNKTLRVVTETHDGTAETFAAMRDAARALTAGNPDLIADAMREAAADGVDDAERDALFNLVEEADYHTGDADAIAALEDVYTGGASVVETLGTSADGGVATCGSDYTEFTVDEKTSTCVLSSLVEWNCYAGSRQVSHPNLGGANACLYYSLDFFQPDGTCRRNYAKVRFNGRETCRWVELGTDGTHGTAKAAWYTLEKVHGVESSQTWDSIVEGLGNTFQDCADCPAMVRVPAGFFLMGAPESEPESSDDERPQRWVTVPAFAAGAYEVTFAEWDACVAGGGCDSYRPDDESWGRGDSPVINVSWEDAQRYVEWLSSITGQPYRLLTESEWEYAARAGTTTPFSTGVRITLQQANFNGRYGYPDGNDVEGGLYREQTVPVGSFAPNGFGLHDMHGNVSEWVQDCYGDYAVAPSDGSAVERSPHRYDCDYRVLRGGSWDSIPWSLRSAFRIRINSGFRDDVNGFRVARALTP